LSANPASAWTLTATGTITSSPTTSFDNANLFGLGSTSLVGQSYTLTITTDPWINQYVELIPTGGGGVNGIYSTSLNAITGATELTAGYTLTITIGNQSFSQRSPRTELENIARLDNGASHNYGVAPYSDSLSQGVVSSGCSRGTSSYLSNGTTPCVAASIAVSSYTTPFVPYLDFNLVTSISPGAADGANFGFNYINTDNSAADSTQLNGTLESLTVNAH
jgi:hypothetical protein